MSRNVDNALARAKIATTKSERCLQRSYYAQDHLATFRAKVLEIRKRNYDILTDFIEEFLELYPWGNLDDLKAVFKNNYPNRPTSF